MGKGCWPCWATTDLLLPLSSTNDYGYKERLKEQQLTLLPIRKRNSKRPAPSELTAQISRIRKRIETTFSQVSTRLARRIAAVTEAGFESKVFATWVTHAIVGVASWVYLKWSNKCAA
jgi:hypothetical protein